MLVTGFEPFGGHTVNSSGEAVRALGRSSGGVPTATAVLPVVYGAAVEALAAAIARADPELVVAVGQSEGRGSISVERTALGVSTAEQPDEAGRRGTEVPTVPDGPDAYASTLPVERVVAELQRAGVPAVASDDAGGYVCNHVFYGLMHLLATERPGTIGGFVHVPLLPEQAEPGAPSMPRETLVRALELVVAASARESTAPT